MEIPNFHDRRAEVRNHPKGRSRVIRAKSPRDLSKVDSVVLHSMGFDWSQYPLEHYYGVDCHFAVLRRGSILWLHDPEDYLNASDEFNRRAIAIEFEGNPASDLGGAFDEETFGQHEPTLSQIFSGRSLLLKLKVEYDIARIHAHRQADGGGRGNCPGPHVWYNVGEYGRRIGMSDGGTGFHLAGGKAIRDTWRDPKWDLTVFNV